MPTTRLATCHDFEKPTAVTAGSRGCEECERTGDWWLHLRVCLTCGKVGCCDDSPNRHATAHNHETGHATIASFEPGEDWGYCYPHDVFIEHLPTNIRVARPGGED
jgi:uncharacterized UBP type Zn finger protein